MEIRGLIYLFLSWSILFLVFSSGVEIHQSEVSDGLELVSADERVQHSIQHDYSSLIVDKEGSSTISLTSSVESGSRDVEIEVDGESIEPEFVGGEGDSKIFNVAEDQPEMNRILVRGEEVGETELEITATDQEWEISREKTFPVYVRESTVESQNAPGLEFYNIIAIGILGAIVYFVSL